MGALGTRLPAAQADAILCLFEEEIVEVDLLGNRITGELMGGSFKEPWHGEEYTRVRIEMAGWAFEMDDTSAGAYLQDDGSLGCPLGSQTSACVSQVRTLM